MAPVSFLSRLFLLLVSIFANLVAAQDIYRLDSGSPRRTQLEDGRIFRSDNESEPFLSTENLVRTSINSISNSSPSPSLPLYLTARIFLANTAFTFSIFSPGPHWVRLYFYPLPHPQYSLSNATFTVTGNCLVLLKDFSQKDNPTTVLKEYLIDIRGTKFSLNFSPAKNSIAYINALELVSSSHLTSKESSSRLMDGNCERRKSTIQMKYFVGFCLALGILAMGWMAAILLRWHRSFEDWTSLILHSNLFCLLSSTHSGQPAVRFFSLSQLKKLTHNFDEKAKIAKGGFGDVYIGRWRNGTNLAIKKQRADSIQGPEEFYKEVEVLSKVCHRNIVRLIGYCDEASELALVYEYMKKGDFARRLKGSDGVPPLTWTQRMEVCIGAGRGLLHLHDKERYVHRDIKAANILLDEDLTAKLADFGLCKALPKEFTHVTTQLVRGSRGYLDPRYAATGQVSEKSDIHSFGVLLLEVISSKCPTEDEVDEFAESGTIEGKIDTRIGPISPESLRIVVEAAKSCVSRDPQMRLAMGNLLHQLDLALKTQKEYLGVV